MLTVKLKASSKASWIWVQCFILAYFHGHTVKIDGHRKDVASVFPAKSLIAHMTAWNPGKWLLNCLVNDHYAAGMSAVFNVTKCGSKKSAPTMQALGGKTREYFIAAEEKLWDYAPSRMDNFNGGSLTDENGYVWNKRAWKKWPRTKTNILGISSQLLWPIS